MLSYKYVRNITLITQYYKTKWPCNPNCFFAYIVFALYPMFTVPLDCPFVIAPSVFANVY